jgi:hypothetical protein
VVSESKGASRLKKLARQVPNHRLTVETLLALENRDHFETDRMIAVLGGAFAENAVRLSITAHLKYMSTTDESAVFGFNGPLGTFSNKITMGYAMGIYGEMTKKDLDIIRNIRNTFAHTLGNIHFSHADVVGECDKLYHVGEIDMAAFLKGAKARYVRAVVNISAALRASIERLSPLGRFPFPDKALP